MKSNINDAHILIMLLSILALNLIYLFITKVL